MFLTYFYYKTDYFCEKHPSLSFLFFLCHFYARYAGIHYDNNHPCHKDKGGVIRFYKKDNGEKRGHSSFYIPAFNAW